MSTYVCTPTVVVTCFCKCALRQISDLCQRCVWPDGCILEAKWTVSNPCHWYLLTHTYRCAHTHTLIKIPCLPPGLFVGSRLVVDGTDCFMFATLSLSKMSLWRCSISVLTSWSQIWKIAVGHEALLLHEISYLSVSDIIQSGANVELETPPPHPTPTPAFFFLAWVWIFYIFNSLSWQTRHVCSGGDRRVLNLLLFWSHWVNVW